LYGQSAQLELLDNAGETKLTVLGQEVPDDTIRDVARAKGLDLDTDRLSLPDRITQLHLTLLRQPRRDDILGGTSGRIRPDPIDAKRLLTTQGGAALPGGFPIGIDGILSPGQAGMDGRAASTASGAGLPGLDFMHWALERDPALSSLTACDRLSQTACPFH
jgi:hypothetical protein